MPFTTSLDTRRVAGRRRRRRCRIFLRRRRLVSGGEAVSDGDGPRLGHDPRFQVGRLRQRREVGLQIELKLLQRRLDALQVLTGVMTRLPAVVLMVVAIFRAEALHRQLGVRVRVHVVAVVLFRGQGVQEWTRVT